MSVSREKLQEMLDEARVLMRILREAPAAGFNPVHFQAQSARWLALVSDVHTALMELWDLQDRQQENAQAKRVLEAFYRWTEQPRDKGRIPADKMLGMLHDVIPAAVEELSRKKE